MTRAADLAKLIAGGGTITVADNSTNITLKSTDDDANGGPVFDLTRDSASPADNDTMGSIRFRSDDDGGNETQFVDVTGYAPDVSDGSEDGQLQIRTIVGGTLRNRLDLASGETVFNEDSVDIDFRVESNSNANMLFVDGGNNKVGIGTNSPNHDLHLHKSTSDGNFLLITNSTTGSNSNDGAAIGLAADETLLIYHQESSAIRFGTASTERMRILAGGGLTFNGDTATANALDDYEEGTWTAQISDGSTDVDLTTSAVYTKIGNLVTVSFDKYNVNISSLSSSSDLSIKTLPFPSNATSHGNKIIHITGTSSGSNVPVLLYPVNTATGVALYKAVSSSQNMASLKPSDLASQVSVRLTLTYFTDS